MSAIEGGGIRPNIEVSQGKTADRFRPLRDRIALSLVPAWLGVVSIACGPGRGGEVQSPAAAAQAAELPTSTAVPTIAPTESPKPTATPEAKPTAAPIGIGGHDIPKFGLPEIDAIGEKLANEATRGQVSEKDVIRWNAVVQLDANMSAINTLTEPLNPRVTQETFDLKKGGIKDEIQKIKKFLEQGNIEVARNIIYRTRDVPGTQAIEVSGLIGAIVNLGDPLQEKLVPQELKQKHDPNDKYIK